MECLKRAGKSHHTSPTRLSLETALFTLLILSLTFSKLLYIYLGSQNIPICKFEAISILLILSSIWNCYVSLTKAPLRLRHCFCDLSLNFYLYINSNTYSPKWVHKISLYVRASALVWSHQYPSLLVCYLNLLSLSLTWPLRLRHYFHDLSLNYINSKAHSSKTFLFNLFSLWMATLSQILLCNSIFSNPQYLEKLFTFTDKKFSCEIQSS